MDLELEVERAGLSGSQPYNTSLGPFESLGIGEIGGWLKPGAIVLDVGTNAVEDASIPKGYRLVGDVDHASAVEHAGWLSPVPGGVGPMTIAMLLDNTLHAATTALQVLPVQGGVSHGATVQVQPHNDAL